MTNYEDIRGRMPYKEPPAYIQGLIDRCKEEALRTPARAVPVIRPWMYGIAAALAAALITLSITLNVNRGTPMERFLAGISDEEAEMLVNFDIEDITFNTNN